MSDTTSRLTNDVLDREQIDLLCSLDDGAGDLLAEVIGEFLLVSDGLRSQLLDAMGQGDLPVAKMAAHTLKGASANVGAARLADVCAELDTRADAIRSGDVSTLVDRFETEYTNAVAALQELSTEG